ncbi:hypothetical protein SASPL_156773 [Salvia splendens]|uniref:Disease resistance protein winged helix domain-containing protein n=1 Tax=Salvia splendens TaxID=180675 RepID=A0A8X8YWK5_SALSN|nr:hypothetical protein SASPL_156773 [Salvia splendens]
MWRSIDMRNTGDLWEMPYHLDKMCCHAVDRSHGQLIVINTEYFGTDELLHYISQSFDLAKINAKFDRFSLLRNLPSAVKTGEYTPHLLLQRSFFLFIFLNDIVFEKILVYAFVWLFLHHFLMKQFRVNPHGRNLHQLIVEDEQFQEIMLLSYTNLTHSTGSCFLYMCSFPDDYEIRVSVLVKLWMAEGFVKYQWGAEDIVTEIMRTNLASITAIKCNGSVHDLVRDVYKIKAIDENFERRISNSHLDLREVARAYASTMRSVISFQPNGLRKFKLLRVLDVVNTDAYSLPASVFDLFHLRYLASGYPEGAASSDMKKLLTLSVCGEEADMHRRDDETDL